MVAFSEILKFDPGQIQEIFGACSGQQQTCTAIDGHLKNLSDLHTWQGDASQAAKDAAGKTRKNLDAHGNEVWKVAAAARDCYNEAVELKTAATRVQADADAKGFLVDPITGTVTDPNPPVMRGWADADKAAYYAEIDALQARVNDVIAAADRFDDDLAAAINAADGSIPLTPKGEGANVNLADRRANQIAAYRKTYGKDPVTANDWRAAEMLDPHSYLEKNQGVSANVVVAKIRPVPGHGVVSSGLFIPTKEVISGIGSHDMGDNRSFDNNFDPERSRVSFLVDYDKGLVIARQSPSVSDDGTVEAGTPSVGASQLDDGSVKISYDASDPLAPPGAAQAGWSVNGQIAYKPEPSGAVSASGVTTNFPSLEVYQHGSDGTTSTIYQDDAGDHTTWGPLANLPFVHGFGDRSLLDQFGGNETPHIPLGSQIPMNVDTPADQAPIVQLGDRANPPTVSSR